MEGGIVQKYCEKRHRFFVWRCNLDTSHKLILSTIFACITGIAAQIRIPLPWTPVPITGQTLPVLLSGVVLGKWWGGISQAVYLAIGMFGVPWFSGFKGGIDVVFGPTGGYLLGFIFASLFLGHFVDEHIEMRKFRNLLFLMVIANFGLIYLPGLVQLGVWLSLTNGSSPGILKLLWMGAIPFILGDSIKVFLAAILARIITPREQYCE